MLVDKMIVDKMYGDKMTEQNDQCQKKMTVYKMTL